MESTHPFPVSPHSLPHSTSTPPSPLKASINTTIHTNNYISSPQMNSPRTSTTLKASTNLDANQNIIVNASSSSSSSSFSSASSSLTFTLMRERIQHHIHLKKFKSSHLPLSHHDRVLTESATSTRPKRPDFFSPKVKHSSKPFYSPHDQHHQQANHGNNDKDSSMPKKRRQRSEEVVEDMFLELRMDTGEEDDEDNDSQDTSDEFDADSIHLPMLSLPSSVYNQTPSGTTPSPLSCAPISAILHTFSPIVNIHPTANATNISNMIGSASSTNAAPSQSTTITAFQSPTSNMAKLESANLTSISSHPHQPSNAHGPVPFSSLPSPTSLSLSTSSSSPALVDSTVLSHLTRHLSLLPNHLAQGLNADILTLIILYKIDFTAIPSGGPLTQQQFITSLQSIGCESDQQLQLLLQDMILQLGLNNGTANDKATPLNISLPSTPISNSSQFSSSSPSSSSSSSSLIPLPSSSRSSSFKSFYLQCFYLIKKLCSPFNKSIDLSTARYFIQQLLGQTYSAHIFPFLAFLHQRELQTLPTSNHRSSTVSMLSSISSSSSLAPFGWSTLRIPSVMNVDQWSLLLDWCQTIHPHTLDGYEVEGCWPILFDEFVQWLCRTTKPSVSQQYSNTSQSQFTHRIEPIHGNKSIPRAPAQVSPYALSSTPSSSSSSQFDSHLESRLRFPTSLTDGILALDDEPNTREDLLHQSTPTSNETRSFHSIASFSSSSSYSASSSSSSQLAIESICCQSSLCVGVSELSDSTSHSMTIVSTHPSLIRSSSQDTLMTE